MSLSKSHIGVESHCSNSLKGVHKLLLIAVQFPLRLHNILKCTCTDALQSIVVVTYDAKFNYIHSSLENFLSSFL